MGALTARVAAAAVLTTAVAAASPADASARFVPVHQLAVPKGQAAPAAAGRITLRTSRRFVFLGERVRLRGRLTRNGRGLGRRLVRLKADPYPFGNGYRTLTRVRTARDGRFGFVGPPKRNTRFRVTGARARSRSVLVYADYPGRERHRWRRGRLRMGFTIYAPFNTPGPPSGRIHFYLTQNGLSTMPRVASTRMRRIGNGYMRGRAVARTRRPRRGERVWVCWREETTDGFGIPDPLDPLCGDAVVPTPPPP